MEENNATCSICGSGYYVCLSCKDKMKLHPYKAHCCSPSHFQVYQVIHGFSTGVYTKDEVKDKLKNIDLGNLNYFRPHIKKIIKDILRENKSVAKVVEKVKPVETEVSEVKEEVVEKTISRKRSYKVEAE